MVGYNKEILKLLWLTSVWNAFNQNEQCRCLTSCWITADPISKYLLKHMGKTSCAQLLAGRRLCQWSARGVNVAGSWYLVEDKRLDSLLSVSYFFMFRNNRWSWESDLETGPAPTSAAHSNHEQNFGTLRNPTFLQLPEKFPPTFFRSMSCHYLPVAMLEDSNCLLVGSGGVGGCLQVGKWVLQM
jgi:hypothetical protein